jgi:hypothetical protein
LNRTISQVQKFTKDPQVKKTLVLVLNGGLGNQLFQLAYALDKSTIYDVAINTRIGQTRPVSGIYPEILNYELPQEIEIDESQVYGVTRKLIGLFIRMRLHKFTNKTVATITNMFYIIAKKVFGNASRVFDEIHVANEIGKTDLNLSQGNQLVIGYFQTFEWENSIRVKKLISELSPKFGNKIISKYALKSQRDKPLVVHIRIGDYKLEPNFGIISRTYLEHSLLEAFKMYEYSKIWLFSDDPSEAVKMLPKEYLSIVELIPEISNSATLTLEVMRMGHGYVLSNSTYSWWAAFLSRTEPHIVTVPKPWFVNLPEPKGMFPNSWTRILR